LPHDDNGRAIRDVGGTIGAHGAVGATETTPPNQGQGGEVASPFEPVHVAGTKPADYLRELSRNPDILRKNIDQAGNFNFVGGSKLSGLRPGGRSIPLKGSAPSYVESKWADPATNERLVAMNKAGAKFDEIAAEFGVSRGAVAGRLDRIRQAEGRARKTGKFKDVPDWFKEEMKQ
jgi:hypothetical protein